MASAKQNAINLYTEGIITGRPREAVAAYTGERYTQHSTGVADGAEGFIAFFEPFLQRNPVRDVQLLRTLQDGRYVFVHALQSLNNGQSRWVTTDFFDSDARGKIVEHWDVIARAGGLNRAGRSQVDGATEIEHLERTAENKALVLQYVERCLIGRDVARMCDFISADSFLQHSADLDDGLDATVAHFARDDCALRYQQCFLAVAEGNFVATLSRATLHGNDMCHADVFRVERAKIVEHWDNSEPVPPKEQWVNSGKF